MDKKIVNVVAAAIQRITPDGRIEFFCAKRGAPKPGKPANESNYRWEFPGGKIESGETPEQALEREIKEEFNAMIKVQDFFCKVEFDYKEFILNMQVFFCRLVEENLELLEHIDSCWALPEALPQLDWAPADFSVALKLCARR